MALKGSLRDFSTTQLLNLISLARKTGTLTITTPASEAELAFKEGKLIFANQHGQNSHLAALLQKANKLSKEQAQAIQEHGQNIGDKELGLMLISQGYVTQNDILASVRTHVLDIVYRVFTWMDGSFRFEASLPPEDRITAPIDLEAVILEGTRRVKEYQRLQDELPDLDLVLKFTDRPNAVRTVNLAPQEWRVVSYINAQNTIRQIGQVNHLSEYEMRRIVYGLIQAGLAEVIQPGHSDPSAVPLPISPHSADPLPIPLMPTATNGTNGTAASVVPAMPAVAAPSAPSSAAPTSRLAAAARARPASPPETRPADLAAKAAASPKRSLVLRIIDRIRGL